MKKLISIAFAAVVAFGFTSCKKTETSYYDPSLVVPQINASIFRVVNQPTDAVLGESSASFAVGDRVIVYVPYQISYDEIAIADLMIRNDMGELMMISPLQVSMDPVAEGLNVPAELQGTQFLYGSIEVIDGFANQSLALSVELRGAKSGYGTDKIENAFVVNP